MAELDDVRDSKFPKKNLTVRNFVQEKNIFFLTALMGCAGDGFPFSSMTKNALGT